MNNQLMTDIGENLEYVKTIVNNTVELNKIKAIEKSSNIVGYSLLAVVLTFFIMLIFSLGIVLCTLLLAQEIQSYSYAILIVMSALFLLAIVLYLLRNILILGPVSNMLYKLIIKK